MSDKIQTLSTAMNLGARMCPQAIGTWKIDEKRCALQTAMFAIAAMSGRDSDIELSELQNRFPVLREQVPSFVLEPVNKALKLRWRECNWQTFIMRLNDKKQLTREKIAWLLTLVGA